MLIGDSLVQRYAEQKFQKLSIAVGDCDIEAIFHFADFLATPTAPGDFVKVHIGSRITEGELIVPKIVDILIEHSVDLVGECAVF